MEKLGQLAATGRWDLIVVDTPPSRSALDFLDAPQRMSTFLDGRMIRLLSSPARAGGRGLRKIVGAGFALFAKAVSTILGGQLLADASAFVQAFDTMFGGFGERATATYSLLRSPGTAFVVVASGAGPRARRPTSRSPFHRAMRWPDWFSTAPPVAGPAVLRPAARRPQPRGATPPLRCSGCTPTVSFAIGASAAVASPAPTPSAGAPGPVVAGTSRTSTVCAGSVTMATGHPPCLAAGISDRQADSSSSDPPDPGSAAPPARRRRPAGPPRRRRRRSARPWLYQQVGQTAVRRCQQGRASARHPAPHSALDAVVEACARHSVRTAQPRQS